MPVALAVGVVAAAGIGAVAMSSASNKAANASQVATDASVANNRETLASEEKRNTETLAAAQARTQGAIDTTTGAQNQSYEDILAHQNENKGIWQGFRDSLTPYTDLGKSGAAALANPGQAFSTSPDFNFRLQTGLNSVGQNKAVNGLLKSGSALKALNNYGSNTASNEFSNWWARQNGLVGTGLTAEGYDRTGVAGITGANDTISNADNSRAIAVGNAATGAATNVNSLAGSLNNNLNASATNLNNNNNDSIQSNATNQGNAGLVQANAVGNFAGSAVSSIGDILSKYSMNSTGSSYSAANNNAPWGDTVSPGYAGVVVA